MIGYYVHHQGQGHLQRARQIAAALDERVTVLSSLPPAGVSTPFADWIQLARDDVDPDAHAHEAAGALHWAPLNAPGYSRRMQQVATWLQSARPRLLVVDVSVEVTALGRLLGVPVVVVAGAGTRADAAHTLGYRVASAIIAPWSGQVYRPAHLADHVGKTRYTGALSRFDALPVSRPPSPGSVFVLQGSGGTEITPADVRRAAAAVPNTTWTVAGPSGGNWTDDVWGRLCTAEVVISHAGQNALAELAAARRPAVVIPQDRPFGEQRATADALAAYGLATVRPRWPAPDEWPELLAVARSTDGSAWSAWNHGDGAARAAAAIDEVATAEHVFADAPGA